MTSWLTQSVVLQYTVMPRYTVLCGGRGNVRYIEARYIEGLLYSVYIRDRCFDITVAFILSFSNPITCMKYEPERRFEIREIDRAEL